jgi:hypothetical protein
MLVHSLVCIFPRHVSAPIGGHTKLFTQLQTNLGTLDGHVGGGRVNQETKCAQWRETGDKLEYSSKNLLDTLQRRPELQILG